MIASSGCRRNVAAAWLLVRRRREGATHVGSGRGFTLVEALLVITIIAMLATITIPLFGMLRARAGGAVCISNLRTLHTAFNVYMQDHNGVWPQAPGDGSFDTEVQEWRFWHDTMRDYGIGRKHWICPTDGDTIKADEMKQHDDFIGSYSVTHFDNNPGSAMKWRMPWVIERGGGHTRNGGPNMLMPDGTIQEGISLLAPPP